MFVTNPPIAPTTIHATIPTVPFPLVGLNRHAVP